MVLQMQTRLGNNCYGLLSHLETITMVSEMQNWKLANQI